MMFKPLSPEEVADYKQWARENYKKFSPISGVWHPVVQQECVAMNTETGYNFDVKTELERIFSQET